MTLSLNAQKNYEVYSVKYKKKPPKIKITIYVLLLSRRHKDVCISFSVGGVFANIFMNPKEAKQKGWHNSELKFQLVKFPVPKITSSRMQQDNRKNL